MNTYKFDTIFYTLANALKTFVNVELGAICEVEQVGARYYFLMFLTPEQAQAVQEFLNAQTIDDEL